VLVAGADRGLAPGPIPRPHHADLPPDHLPQPVGAHRGRSAATARLPAHRPGHAPPARQAPAPRTRPAHRRHPDPPAAVEADGRRGPGTLGRRPGAGQAPSAVLTLVERTSRSVVLVALPAGWPANQVRPALTTAMGRLPEQLGRWLTWDHGKEMAEHARLTADTGGRCSCATRAALGSEPATRTPTGWSATTCPGPPIYGVQPGRPGPHRPRSSPAALDRSTAFRHPHTFLAEARRRSPETAYVSGHVTRDSPRAMGSAQ
jgi:hypothetical protein